MPLEVLLTAGRTTNYATQRSMICRIDTNETELRRGFIRHWQAARDGCDKAQARRRRLNPLASSHICQDCKNHVLRSHEQCPSARTGYVQCGTSLTDALEYRGSRDLHEVPTMDSDIERRRAVAEGLREQRELKRQAAELARNAAEESRVSAENGRRAVADEVSETVATLTTLLNRMQAVEALRRDARKDVP